MSSYATKYFAIKTTVGQEKTVANILEARLHGIFLDYMDEPAGMFTITSEKHAAVVFTPPKTVNMKRKEKRGEGVWLGTSSLTLENPEDQKGV
jgi:hypothetical protein